MKANVWTSGKFRIVERFNKVTAVSTFDIQFKSHHVWTNLKTGLTADEIEEKFKIDVHGKPQLN